MKDNFRMLKFASFFLVLALSLSHIFLTWQIVPLRSEAVVGQSAGTGLVNVLTQHNDNNRTGANLNETILNTANVNARQFGKLFSRQVAGQIYAQPLYASQINISNQGARNVVYVALAGRGEIDVELMVEGKTANMLKVNIK